VKGKIHGNIQHINVLMRRGENMCSSYDFIERQAQEMSEMIRGNSIYKLVRLEFNSGLSQDLQNNAAIQATPDFIKRVVLEDQDGTLYSIEPGPNGFSFAKGEISYKEYLRRTNRDTLNIVTCFSFSVGFFGLFSWLLMKLIL
jgi:hypothetical protein